MRIRHWFSSHKHYWGIPYHRREDQRLVQTCYECGKERELDIDLRRADDLRQDEE